MTKFLKALILAVVVAALTYGAVSMTSGGPEHGDDAKTPAPTRKTLTIGMTQYPSTMHPAIDAMLAKSYVLGMTRRPLTIYDPNWEQVCMLCEKLPSLEDGSAVIEKREDGSEGIATTYTIREGAAWGDGTPVTTKDVLFSWEVGRHPQSGVSNFELYANDIVDITVVDDRTFTIHLDKVTCEYAGLDDFEVLPEHLERAVFEEDPATYKDRTLFDADTTNPGLYYGPYRIEKFEPGSSFTLVANDTWWGRKPAFDRIVIKIIENSAALGANLLSGEVDYIAGELGMTIDQALSFEKRLKDRKPGEYKVLYKPGLIYEHIDFNLDNPVMSDARLRKALLYGIDRAAISAELFDGQQPVAHSNINPLDSVYSEDITTYAHDPAAAEKLLDEAGWKKRDDGFRYNDAGENLVVEMKTTSGNQTRELVQQVIQSDWRKIGVDSVIDNEPARVLFGQSTRERTYKDTVMYAWLSTPRNIPRTTLHSTMIPTPENNYAGQNYPGFKNAETDKIIDDLETVCEPEANRALWTRLQQIYTEQLPALPLYFRAEAYIIPTWLTGITPTGHQYTTTNWVETWSDARGR